MRARTLALILALVLLIPLTVAQAAGPDRDDPFAPDGLQWQTALPYAGATLTLVGPDGAVTERTYSAGEPLFWNARDAGLPDGAYTYTLSFTAVAAEPVDVGRDGAVAESAPADLAAIRGAFRLRRGLLAPVDENGAVLLDQVVPDDLITTGSLCVGFDCVNNESFGFDTIRLKENNTRIAFDDTSSTAGFPANDWQIVANDSSSGGASYLAFLDVTGSRVPFTVRAGAPTNALYVDPSGRIGLGTGAPVLKLELVAGDTPGVRLNQRDSGWTPQTWDVAGNESNFFVRDVTGGSKLPFRIQPGAPTNALTLKANGYVGLGIWSPSYPLHLSTTASDAVLAVQRTDGATGTLRSGELYVDIGSLSNHAVRFVVNDTVVASLDAAGNLSLKGRVIQNVALTAAGDTLAEPEAAADTQEARIAALEARNADLEERLAALEALLSGPQRATR